MLELSVKPFRDENGVVTTWQETMGQIFTLALPPFANSHNTKPFSKYFEVSLCPILRSTPKRVADLSLLCSSTESYRSQD